MTDDRPTATAMPQVFPTVVHMLADAAARAPEHPALIFGDTTLSYAEYLRCVAGFARELIELGAAGERVALILGNSIDMAVALFAVHAAGAQAVPLNPIYTGREISDLLADAAPAVVLYDSTTEAIVAPLAAGIGARSRIVGGTDSAAPAVWRDDTAAALPHPLPGPDMLAGLQYTGGTTGRPKGADISHGQLAINISQREALAPTLAEHERTLCVLPLFHVYASSVCLHLSVYCRGTLVILPAYRPAEVLAAIARERITLFPGSPTVYTGLMAHEDFAKTDFSSLRLCYSGSAPLPEETLKSWQDATGCAVLEGYGQSEAGPVISFNPEHGVRKAGSVGVPLPLTEIEIVDTESGTTRLPAGKRGEIRLRGPQVMSGYRNRPDETAEALRGGWLYTGDIGEIDADGYLFIRDRKKDMAIVGGYNVYPREIDEVLYAHPAVLEAASLGVADKYRGEVVKSYVALKPGAAATADEIIAHCRENLAKYKVPVEIVFVDALPKTTVGKIDKLSLRTGG